MSQIFLIVVISLPFYCTAPGDLFILCHTGGKTRHRRGNLAIMNENPL